MIDVKVPRHLTVRNVPLDLALALAAARQRRGTSLNQTVIDLLRQSLGLVGDGSNGLEKLAGTWDEEQFREFQSAVAPFEVVDPENWR
jgi:hypothetical protein